MTIQTKKYVRRTFEVDAVRITEENMKELADWSGGKIQKTDVRGELESYIFVHVHTPIHERQKMGFVGDWLLKSDKGFKIFTPIAFDKMYVEAIPFEKLIAAAEEKADRKLVDPAEAMQRRFEGYKKEHEAQGHDTFVAVALMHNSPSFIRSVCFAVNCTNKLEQHPN